VIYYKVNKPGLKIINQIYNPTYDSICIYIYNIIETRTRTQLERERDTHTHKYVFDFKSNKK
jgi:hypothetical protein